MNVGLCNRWALAIALTLALFSGSGPGAWAQEDPLPALETFPEPGPPMEPRPPLPEALLSFLSGGKNGAVPSGIRIEIDAKRWAAIDQAACETCGTGQRLQIGVNEPVGFTLDIATAKREALPQEAGGGLLQRTSNGALLWWTPIEAPGAGGLRLAFEDFWLPEGVAAYWGSERGEVFGPYTAAGPLGKGYFWSNTLSGDRGYLMLLTETSEAAEQFFKSRFLLATAAAMKPGFDAAARQFSNVANKQLESCAADATCFDTNDFPYLDVLRAAVAFLVYQRDDGAYICTGSLLSDNDTASEIPYFLTANHCFDTQQSADSLECYWDFQTMGCNAGFVDAASVEGVARSLGAQLLATGTPTDFTFLRLDGPIPGGRWFLGWTTTPPVSGDILYRVAHPRGAQQAYSVHRVVSNPSISCDGRPNTAYIHSVHSLGATAPGSSGSAAVNQFGQVAGQLFGSCFEENCDACDTGCLYYELDGRFSATFSAVETWLAAVSAPPINDDFAGALQLTGNQGNTMGSNEGATREVGEPSHAGFATGATVWWVWSAPEDAEVTFSTCGSDFDTVIAIYRGAALDALIPVAQGDDECDAQSQATFTAAMGSLYAIAVQGYATETGTITLAWDSTPISQRAPTLTSVSPNHGPTSGGTSVTLEGSDLTGVDEVRFGDLLANAVIVVNGSTITCVSPAGMGATNVTARSTRGTSNGLTFTYKDEPLPPASIALNRTVDYGNCWQRSGSIQVPGATQVRLVLDNLNIETCCDELRVADTLVTSSGQTVTTGFVSGDTINLALTSDRTNGGAFRITSIEFEGTATGGAVLTGDLFDGLAGDDCPPEESMPCGCMKSSGEAQAGKPVSDAPNTRADFATLGFAASLFLGFSAMRRRKR